MGRGDGQVRGDAGRALERRGCGVRCTFVMIWLRRRSIVLPSLRMGGASFLGRTTGRSRCGGCRSPERRVVAKEILLRVAVLYCLWLEAPGVEVPRLDAIGAIRDDVASSAYLDVEY